MQATPTYMQYRKARRAGIWDTTWVTLGQKGGAKVAFLPASLKIALRFPCLSIHLSPLFTCATIMSHTLLPCDLTFVYSVDFDDSGNARMQAATHVMPTESLIDWKGLPEDLFIGLHWLKAKLVFRYERPDLFLLNFCHCSCKIHTRLSSFFSIAEQKHSSHWSNNWLLNQHWLVTTLAYIYHSKLAWSACLHVVGLSFGIPCLTEQNDCLCIWIPHQRRAMLKMKETLVISLLICNLRAGSFLFTMAGHCNVMLHSLVPRPHPHMRAWEGLVTQVQILGPASEFESVQWDCKAAFLRILR